jgi:ATP-binding cassette subfamily B (MDR/TAP) protein 1
MVKKKGNMTGIMLGISQSAMFAVYGTIFYVSAVFVRDYNIDPMDMFISIFCIMFAAFGAGNNV